MYLEELGELRVVRQVVVLGGKICLLSCQGLSIIVQLLLLLLLYQRPEKLRLCAIITYVVRLCSRSCGVSSC